MSSPQLRASDRVIFTPLVDGTGVLLDLDTKFYFTLNPTGVEVWAALSEGAQDVDALVDRVTSKFAVDADTARADITELLRTLQDESLLSAA